MTQSTDDVRALTETLGARTLMEMLEEHIVRFIINRMTRARDDVLVEVARWHGDRAEEYDRRFRSGGQETDRVLAACRT